jgi:hypothetical protein
MRGTTLPNGLTAEKIEKLASGIDDPLERLRYLRAANAVPVKRARRTRLYGWLSLLVIVIPMRSDATVQHHRQRGVTASIRRTVPPEVPNVWMIEPAKDHEIYSNGLRVETRFAVANEARLYRLEARVRSSEGGPQRSQPAGIVYHTTESDQLPFEADQTRALQRVGEELLLFVRNKRAYHYLIDRFGRVHRIVEETDAANHAGNSVWADSQWVYLELNRSFLGVAFEARMAPDQQPINPAQVHAAKILTEMLRSKYNLPAENCVTHAQVSVNPGNMRIGWHTDWGRSFPFREVGLPDNYQQPLPSLYLFGFDYDPAYLNLTGPALWNGLSLAEAQMSESAAANHLGAAQYKSLLRQQYLARIAALQGGANKEN